MAIDRALWMEVFYPSSIPALPCPRCGKGRLKAGEVLQRIEPAWSAAQSEEDEWEPYWSRERFAALLTCDNAKCGEVVAVSGDTQVIQNFNDEGNDYDFETVLRPRSMFPAPPLFILSKELPDAVHAQLRLAFQLFWSDISAATSRVRTSLELALDELKVPRVGKNKKGKLGRLDLVDRIKESEATAKDPDLAESMHALRVVGNLGTHGDEVTREMFFDALDVYEDALQELFEKKSDLLKAKKKKLLELSAKQKAPS